MDTTHGTKPLAESELPVTGAALPDRTRTQAETGPRIELVKGRTMRSALLDARRIHGDRAVVIDQRTVAGGVVLAISTVVPRSTDALASMRAEATRRLEPPRSETVAPALRENTRSPLADVERRLRENGASKRLRERVLESVARPQVEPTDGQEHGQDPLEGHPLDRAAGVVARSFEVASLPVEPGQVELVALLGPSGAGKTATLAKLALRLGRAGRRVVLATLDDERVGAAAQMRAYGEHLRMQVVSLKDPARVAAGLAAAGAERFDVVLIDGSGDVARDAEMLAALELECTAQGVAARLAPLVVLPATASPASLERATSEATPVGPIGAVVTKIDEADQPLVALEHAAARGLGLAFLCNGPDLGPHFHRASGERFADIALTGRIA